MLPRVVRGSSIWLVERKDPLSVPRESRACAGVAGSVSGSLAIDFLLSAFHECALLSRSQAGQLITQTFVPIDLFGIPGYHQQRSNSTPTSHIGSLGIPSYPPPVCLPNPCSGLSDAVYLFSERRPHSESNLALGLKSVTLIITSGTLFSSFPPFLYPPRNFGPRVGVLPPYPSRRVQPSSRFPSPPGVIPPSLRYPPCTRHAAYLKLVIPAAFLCFPSSSL